jgi:2-polyprenyl-3-methyl-5-hydroxy-6-metoxy-1,4-benzoquinol methylase
MSVLPVKTKTVRLHYHVRAMEQATLTVPEGFELIACPGCDSNDYTPAYSGKDWILPSGLTLTVVRCKNCSLAYTNPRPKLDQLGRYYPEEYSPYQKGRGEIERGNRLSTFGRMLILRRAYARPDLKPAWWGWGPTAGFLSLFQSPRDLGFAIPYFGNGRLLDFGCGSGTFLRRMKALGWDVTGLDFSEATVEVVRQTGITAYAGTLPHPELKAKTFDLITMRHALEHVPEPRSILSAALDLLVPGGMIEIQVPNFGGWEIEHFKDAAHTLDLPRHLLHWEQATLGAMLSKCGFTDVKVHQECRASWLQKSAKKQDRYTPDAADKEIAGSRKHARVIARKLEAEGRGNELFATARRPS